MATAVLFVASLLALACTASSQGLGDSQTYGYGSSMQQQACPEAAQDGRGEAGCTAAVQSQFESM